MKLIYIEWQDVISPPQGWRTKEEVLKWGTTSNYKVKQVGWIIREDEKSILLSGQINAEKLSGNDVDNQYVHTICIPKTWILKRKELKV